MLYSGRQYFGLHGLLVVPSRQGRASATPESENNLAYLYHKLRGNQFAFNCLCRHNRVTRLLRHREPINGLSRFRQEFWVFRGVLGEALIQAQQRFKF